MCRKEMMYKLCSRLDWIGYLTLILSLFMGFTPLFLRTVILLSLISFVQHFAHASVSSFYNFTFHCITIVRVGCEHACRIILKLLVERMPWQDNATFLTRKICDSLILTLSLSLFLAVQAQHLAQYDDRRTKCVSVALLNRKALNNYISSNF